MDSGWWARGEACEMCGIAFCHPHKPGAQPRRVWVGPEPIAYHTSPFCGAAPLGIKSRARGSVQVQLDLDGGDPEGVLPGQPAVPPGWTKLGEGQAIARRLPACLRC